MKIFNVFLSILFLGISFSAYSSQSDEEMAPPSTKRPRRRISSQDLDAIFVTTQAPVPPVVEERPSLEHPEGFEKAVKIALRVKILANTYLGDPNHNANIFIPFLLLHIEGPHGQTHATPTFVKRGEKICLFASGGLKSDWEKAVQRIYPLLFGGEKIKIIRGAWMNKHLERELGFSNTFKEIPIGGSPFEGYLHSEAFWKKYAQYFLEPQLGERSLIRIDVHGFSWWDVCTFCHKNQLPSECKLSSAVSVPFRHRISAAYHYSHDYRQGRNFKSDRLQEVDRKKDAELQDILFRTLGVLRRPKLKLEDEKRIFWTTSPGIELAKLLGQAFMKPNPLLDPLVPASAQGLLRELLPYLKVVNWDLSCYYEETPLNDIQKTWQKYWKGGVIPHFGWTEIDTFSLDFPEGICEMCGKKDIKKIHLVYHPKYRGKVGSPALTKAQKIKRSLRVGSKCVKVMTLQEEDLRAAIDGGLDSEGES